MEIFYSKENYVYTLYFEADNIIIYEYNLHVYIDDHDYRIQVLPLNILDC